MNREAIRLGIVGAGRCGASLIRDFETVDGCAVARVCDRNFSRLLYVCEWFPHVPVTADYQELLRDDTLDAVVVATPMATHYDLALAALKAGKDALVAAPLATSGAQADELVATAERLGRVLGVGHFSLCHPAVAQMKRVLATGRLGEWCYVETSHVASGPPETTTNVIWSLGVSDVPLALYLTAERPVEVLATGGNFRQWDLDAAYIMVKYQSGRFSQHHLSWLSPTRVQRIFVAGVAGAMVFDDTCAEGQVRVFNAPRPAGDLDDDLDAADFLLPLAQEEMALTTAGGMSPLALGCADFVEAVRGRGRPLVGDGASGREVVKVLEAANLSIQRGSAPVRLA